MSTSSLGETSFNSLSCHCIKLAKETKKIKKGRKLAMMIKVPIKAQ